MTTRLKNDPIPLEKRKKLRKEYHELPASNRLSWLADKARRAGMSYGDFVNWLGV